MLKAFTHLLYTMLLPNEQCHVVTDGRVNCCGLFK